MYKKYEIDSLKEQFERFEHCRKLEYAEKYMKVQFKNLNFYKLKNSNR
jgi:hypothetical protein